jgi:hypothetical protein
MTRIDLTTRDLHALIAPVLPHTLADPDFPRLGDIRVEVLDGVVYAVATDRVTLAATRHKPDGHADDVTIHLGRDDAANMLRLFKPVKDEDPRLTVTIDQVTVAVHPAGLHGVMSLGFRVDGEDGTRLVLHDRRNPLEVHDLDSWRKWLGKVIHRATRPAAPALLLSPAFLARWSKAGHRGERLTVLIGAKPDDPVLIVCEDHFAGMWQPAGHLDGDAARALDGSPWRDELPAPAVQAALDEMVPAP